MPSSRDRSQMSAAAPEVTVVITTRDRCAWLQRCVDSVCRQEGVSFEVVIVDDASSDGTARWLAALADPRVSVIRLTKCAERSAARNRGLAQARGALVMFL